MIRHLSVAAAALLMAGCSSVRVANAGAPGWRVELSEIVQTNADYNGVRQAGCVVVGWCDPQQEIIRLSLDRSKPLLAADAMHELGHKIEREFPAIWDHLDAMDRPDFPCGSDRLHESQRNEAAALEAARKAAAEAQP